MNKTIRDVEQVIYRATQEHMITLKDGDIEAFGKAYLKFGDIDLALDTTGNVLSDVMEEEDLDMIAEALSQNFGVSAKTRICQRYKIKINGYSYMTYINSLGEQAFVPNEIINNHLSGLVNYEKERLLFQSEEYSLDEWVQFNSCLGTPLSKFLSTIDIRKITIENPRTSF